MTGALGESDHIILDFMIPRTVGTEKKQTCVLDFERVDFGELGW